MEIQDLKKVIAELTRGGLWGPGGRKTQPKPSSVFYSDQMNIPRSDPSLIEESRETPLHHSASLINASGHHPASAEPSELLDRLSLRHHSPNPPLQKLPHYSSATLGTPSRRNTSATLERGTPPPRTFTQEEFAATVLARTRVTLGQRLSSSGETREPCSGECGNIMCSLSAATDEDSLVERPTDGERGSATTENCDGGNGSVVVCPGGEISPSSVGEPSFRSLSGVGEEGTAVTSDQPPSEESNCFMIRERAPANSKSSTDGAGDYASSPVMERRSKSGVLGKFRNLTNRSSYSTSEEGHSQSSDCEDLDESRFSPRDSNNRASTTSFAGKVRDLHRDVKRRFGKLRGSSRSGDNENNRENGEAPIEGGSSMESIPSGSGGSRSSLQAHTPTSSNRSSSSAGEDETASVIGPILGRARALVDVTPSPYDRDALGLKKGDIIDIIAKNNTGTWVGVVKGKVGHFKFINVEEIAVESRARRRRRKERFNPARDNNLANSNSEQGYQDSLASPANERWQPETLEQLLNHFGLQGCMNVLMLHGYEDLNTFREIEKEDLSSLGITSPSLQKRLLRAAEVLFDDDEIDEGDEITNLENEDAMVENGNRHSNEVVLSTNNLDAIDTGFVLSNFSSSSTSRHEVDDQSFSQDVREERQTDVPHSPRPSDFRPNIPASEPSSNERFATDENGIASSTIAFVASSQDELVSTDSGQGDSGESVRGSLRTAAKMLKASSICSVSGYDSEGSLSYSVRMEDFDFGRPDARMEIKNSKGKVPPPIPKRTTPTVVRPSKFPNGTVEVNCNGDAVVSYLYQDHDGYGIMVDSRAAKGVKSATLPRKKLMDANDSNQQQTRHSSSVVQEKVEHHGGSRLLEKKLYKKFGQRKGSLQTQALKNPRPPSLSLLTAVYRKLEDEGIDLGQEPYTDKTGFCGIPPALVQRYAEELQRDIYDVAESMDQARINSLQMRGRRGVPNDFLADACYGPVVEANYSGSLREWLISLGLPMYEEHLRLACMNRGVSHPLEKVAVLRDSDLRNFGIRNARHVRLLTTAIGALNIHLGRLGGLC